jgi:hypothetical protein
VPNCPLIMKGDTERDIIMLMNSSNKAIAEFSVGCLAVGERGSLEAKEIIETRNGPIVAYNGAYMTTMVSMKDLRLKCTDSNWRLSVVRIVFDDKSIWDITTVPK